MTSNCLYDNPYQKWIFGGLRMLCHEAVSTFFSEHRLNLYHLRSNFELVKSVP